MATELELRKILEMQKAIIENHIKYFKTINLTECKAQYPQYLGRDLFELIKIEEDFNKNGFNFIDIKFMLEDNQMNNIALKDVYTHQNWNNDGISVFGKNGINLDKIISDIKNLKLDLNVKKGEWN